MPDLVPDRNEPNSFRTVDPGCEGSAEYREPESSDKGRGLEVGETLAGDWGRKPDSCRRVQIEALRRMTPGERLMQAFELGRIAHTLFVSGLRKRFPDMPEVEFHQLMLKRIAKCYNRNW
jgi:hypothetical protein